MKTLLTGLLLAVSFNAFSNEDLFSGNYILREKTNYCGTIGVGTNLGEYLGDTLEIRLESFADTTILNVPQYELENVKLGKYKKTTQEKKPDVTLISKEKTELKIKGSIMEFKYSSTGWSRNVVFEAIGPKTLQVTVYQKGQMVKLQPRVCLFDRQ